MQAAATLHTGICICRQHPLAHMQLQTYCCRQIFFHRLRRSFSSKYRGCAEKKRGGGGEGQTDRQTETEREETFAFHFTKANETDLTLFSSSYTFHHDYSGVKSTRNANSKRSVKSLVALYPSIQASSMLSHKSHGRNQEDVVSRSSSHCQVNILRAICNPMSTARLT